MANFITINNCTVQPSEVTVVRSDLDSENSFRSVTGKLQRDRICVKTHLSVTYPPLSQEDAGAVLRAMSDTFFDVIYFDPYVGDYTTKTMYVGDRSTPTYARIGDKWIFKSMTFELIEQ